MKTHVATLAAGLVGLWVAFSTATAVAQDSTAEIEAAQKIETLRRDLVSRDVEWSKIARDSNRLTAAITDVSQRMAETKRSLDTETNPEKREQLSAQLADQSRLVTDLEKRFAEGRVRLAENESARAALRRMRADLLAAYRKSALEEDDEVPEDAPLEPPYGVFGGSFDACLTNDLQVISARAGVDFSDVRPLFERDDPSQPITDPKLAKTVAKLAASGELIPTLPFKSYACPDLSRGHRLSTAQVCGLNTSGGSSTVGDIGDTGKNCLFASGGGQPAHPLHACIKYAEQTLALKASGNSAFVRWDEPNHVADCFFFPRSLIERIYAKVGDETGREDLVGIDAEIAKLKAAISKADSDAKRIENAYKGLHDGTGIDAGLENAVQAMSGASTVTAEWEEKHARASRALDIWNATRDVIANMPLDTTSANSATASILFGEVVQRTTDAELFISRGKYSTPLGVLLSALAVPAEEAMKEWVRDDYLADVDNRIQTWEAIASRIEDGIAKQNGLYWDAHADREAAKAFASDRDALLVRSAGLQRKLATLQE